MMGLSISKTGRVSTCEISDKVYVWMPGQECAQNVIPWSIPT